MRLGACPMCGRTVRHDLGERLCDRCEAECEREEMAELERQQVADSEAEEGADNVRTR